MSIAWIVGLVILGIIVLVVVLRRPKKEAPKSQLMAFAESFNQGVFPNGKADHDEGAKMVHEIVEGTLPLDECREIFIKVAVRADMGLNIEEYIDRRWGDRTTEEQRRGIAGYFAIRLLASATDADTVITRHPNGVISYGPRQT